MLAALALFSSSLLVPGTYAPDAEFVLAPAAVSDAEPAQLVVDGWKRTSCDEVLPPAAKINSRQHVVELQVAVRSGEGAAGCRPVMTRFTSVVDLGALAAGKWRVLVNGAAVDTVLEVLADADTAADAELAAVTAVDVDNAAGGGWNAVISGELRNSCERLDEARVVSGLRAFEVTPVVGRRDGDDCAAGHFPFTERVSLPDPPAAGRYLVHVRAPGGAVSTVFSVGDLDVIGKDGH